jgi:hypothetical protein
MNLLGEAGDELGEEEREAREIEDSVTRDTRRGPTGRLCRREMTRFFIFFKAASAACSRSKVM